jgi:hypothetical protein
VNCRRVIGRRLPGPDGFAGEGLDLRPGQGAAVGDAPLAHAGHGLLAHGVAEVRGHLLIVEGAALVELEVPVGGLGLDLALGGGQGPQAHQELRQLLAELQGDELAIRLAGVVHQRAGRAVVRQCLLQQGLGLRQGLRQGGQIGFDQLPGQVAGAVEGLGQEGAAELLAHLARGPLVQDLLIGGLQLQDRQVRELPQLASDRSPVELDVGHRHGLVVTREGQVGEQHVQEAGQDLEAVGGGRLDQRLQGPVALRVDGLAGEREMVAIEIQGLTPRQQGACLLGRGDPRVVAGEVHGLH